MTALGRLLACTSLALGVAGAWAAQAAVSELPLRPSIMPAPKPPSWRGFKREGERELAFSPEGPGRSALTLSCMDGGAAIEIRAPMTPGTSSAAIRLSSGGFVRVFFPKQAEDPTGEGLVTARASAKDEMLQAFRKSGRIMSGRTALIAQTPAEKSAIEDFFAGCA